MQRLKYVKITETKYCTAGIIQTVAKGDVRAYFELADKSWMITSADGSLLIAKGTATSRHKLLVAIKKEITKYGSVFSGEKRKERLTAEQKRLLKLAKARNAQSPEVRKLVKLPPSEAAKIEDIIEKEIANLKAMRKDFI